MKKINKMEKENVYIKISLPGDDDGHYVTIEKAKKIIKDMEINLIEYGDDSGYEFRCILMTEEAFKNLPKFKGF